MVRERSLDSLRGLAALQVVLSHALNFMSASVDVLSPWIRFTPIRFLEGARASVIFFFVLSGFVLTLSQIGENPLPYRPYIVRRLCRIYLPFAASIIIAAILANAIPHVPLPSFPPTMIDWLDASPVTVLRHFFMTGLRRDIELNGVVWSLIHELRISAILPLLVAVVVCAPLRGSAFLIALATVAWFILTALGESGGLYDAKTIFTSLLMTVYYVSPFACGIFVAIRRVEIRHWIQRNVKIAIVLPVLGLVTLHFSMPTLAYDLIVSLLGAWLIAMAPAIGSMKGVLEHGSLLWLGRISYSLYLLHLLVFLTLVNVLHDHMAPVPIALLSVVTSLFTAHFANKWIERPADLLGKRLSRG